MRLVKICFAVGVFLAAGSLASATTVLYDNWNLATVYNGTDYNPKPTFAIADSYLVTFVDTYHWNSGYGMPFVGELAIHSLTTDQTFGWWQASGFPGQNGCENAVWVVEPNIVLPPGTYEVLDSLPHTWSCNEGSNYTGFARVEGTLSSPVPEPVTMTALGLSLAALGGYIRRRCMPAA